MCFMFLTGSFFRVTPQPLPFPPLRSPRDFFSLFSAFPLQGWPFSSNCLLFMIRLLVISCFLLFSGTFADLPETLLIWDFFPFSRIFPSHRTFPLFFPQFLFYYPCCPPFRARNFVSLYILFLPPGWLPSFFTYICFASVKAPRGNQEFPSAILPLFRDSPFPCLTWTLHDGYSLSWWWFLPCCPHLENAACLCKARPTTGSASELTTFRLHRAFLGFSFLVLSNDLLLA